MNKKSTDPNTQYQQTGSLTQNITVSDITHKQHTNRIQNNTQTDKEVTDIQQTRALNRYKTLVNRLFAIKANILENTHKKSTDPHTEYQHTSTLSQNPTVPGIPQKQHTYRIQHNT